MCPCLVYHPEPEIVACDLALQDLLQRNVWWWLSQTRRINVKMEITNVRSEISDKPGEKRKLEK